MEYVLIVRKGLGQIRFRECFLENRVGFEAEADYWVRTVHSAGRPSDLCRAQGDRFPPENDPEFPSVFIVAQGPLRVKELFPLAGEDRVPTLPPEFDPGDGYLIRFCLGNPFLFLCLRVRIDVRSATKFFDDVSAERAV